MSNQEIIERYYRVHRGELVAFVSLRTHHSDETEDIVQEVFLRMLSAVRPISEETVGALAFTLCKNMVIDWYRRRTVRDDVAHELVGSAGVTTGYESAESVLSVREITEQMETGLARLPKDCQEVYRLHVYGGLKVGDICRETGEKYKTVEYRLGLARKQVRNYLRHIS